MSWVVTQHLHVALLSSLKFAFAGFVSKNIFPGDYRLNLLERVESDRRILAIAVLKSCV